MSGRHYRRKTRHQYDHHSSPLGATCIKCGVVVAEMRKVPHPKKRQVKHYRFSTDKGQTWRIGLLFECPGRIAVDFAIQNG